MTASKNADSNIGGMVGASLMGKLNLPGIGGGTSAGGYQPRMFGQRAGAGVGVPPNENQTDGGQSDRSFASRFGSAN